MSSLAHLPLSRSAGRRALCAALLAKMGISTSVARDVEADALLIAEPWFRSSPTPVLSARAFVSIQNRSAEPDRLLYAWSPEARIVELRETSADGGEGAIAFDGLAIPPNGSLVLSPDGPHLLLREVTPSRGPDDDIRIALRFAKTGGILVPFSRRAT